MKNPILRDTLAALGFKKPELKQASPNQGDTSTRGAQSKNSKIGTRAKIKRNISTIPDASIINRDPTQISYRRQLAAHQTPKASEKLKPKKKKKGGKSQAKAKSPSFRGRISAGVMSMQRQIDGWSATRANRPATKVIEETENSKTVRERSFDDLKSKWLSGVSYLGKFSREGLEGEDIHRVRARVEEIEQEWLYRIEQAELDPDCFEWPSTELSLVASNFGYVGRHDGGYLGYLGYHVGKSSELDANERHYLLSKIFTVRLPPLNDVGYFRSWAIPGSAARLRKMAESIAKLAKSRKGRTDGDWSVAIAHWELDLQYLHDEHYVGKFNFFWPR
jgi:hypothetical protein